MFIPSWVIIPLVVIIIILLIVSICMFCSIRCEINELITKIDNHLERVNSNSKLHNESTVTEVFFDYITDLSTCLVFSGSVIIMMYTLLAKYKPNSFLENAIIIISLILALSPLVFFFVDKYNKIKLLFKDSHSRVVIFTIFHFIFSMVFLGLNIGVIIKDKANVIFNLFN